MTTIVSFPETTSAQIAALATSEGTTVEQWLNRYVLDIDRTVMLRGGVDAILAEAEARNAAQQAANDAVQAAPTPALDVD